MTVDRMAIDPTVKTDGFLPSHESDGYGTWYGGSQGPSYGAFQVSGRLYDRGTHGVCKLLCFIWANGSAGTSF